MTPCPRFRSVLALLAGVALTLSACNDDDPVGTIEPGDADLAADITANRTLFADTTYILTNFVHVTNGVTLTIEPGTVIKGRTGTALFILRGAKIVANGTATAPIVLTSDQDVDSRKPGDWGGLIIVGNGIINRSGPVELEGTGTPTANPVVVYGQGTDNADSSGVLRYVRVEFAGFGVANAQELNSFTLAAVGSRTKLEFLQSVAGLDDAFEWFGGAVDGKNLVSYEAGDDHFDASEGYVGRNQFLIAFQDSILDPRAGSGVKSTDPQGFEVDGCAGSGCDLGQNSTPLNIPMFANFTMVGTGPTTQLDGTSGGVGMMIRRGTGGYYVNGVLARWPRAAISLRDAATETRYTNGELILRNISVIQTGPTAGTNAPIFEAGAACPASNCQFTIDVGTNSIVAEPGTTTVANIFAGIPAQPTTASLDLSLIAGAAPRTGGTGAFTGPLLTKGGAFITGTTYRGAWDPTGTKWWDDWTIFAQK